MLTFMFPRSSLKNSPPIGFTSGVLYLVCLMPVKSSLIKDIIYLFWSLFSKWRLFTSIYNMSNLFFSNFMLIIIIIIIINSISHPKYDRLHQTLGLRRKLVVSVKNPTPIPIPHWEKWSWHVVTDSDPLVASSVGLCCVRNLQQEGLSLSQHVGIIFISGDGDQCGVLRGDYRFSIHNPGVRRSPS